MSAGHVHELRIAARGPNRQRVADRPDDEAGDPEAQAKADRARLLGLAIAVLLVRGGERVGLVDRTRPMTSDFLGIIPAP